ncbi:hypothetical protein Tco_0362205, partial [Tanacetum coccineum]
MDEAGPPPGRVLRFLALTSLFHNTSQPAYLEGADTRREEKG